ncbi:MAG: nicotinamidase [Pirellulaceae bacterium]|nr:MAG: nicotinamidase [Pirellulaceae bacterium]
MRALLLIDIQNDFLPGGALPVPRGDEVIGVANRLLGDYPLIVATRDWHPPNHVSFVSQHPGHRIGEVVEVDGISQVLWPDHCIQHTWGAAFAPELNTQRIDHIVSKGTDPRVDSYSGFFDNARRRATGLHDYLRSAGVVEIDIMGLATDYCVQFTVLDACELGYRTRVVLAGCRGVELKCGDTTRAIEAMEAAGAILVE